MRRLFSNAGPLERSASWALPEPALFDPGGGPTVAHSRPELSKRPEDVRLVSAAAKGDLDAVERALPQASLQAHVRLSACLRATTALHAASCAGSVEVVRRLIEARAEVARRHGQLRALTPLHDAACVEVAELLLGARANPWANDPREPDPAWYHEQMSRGAVAALIRRRRAASSAEAEGEGEASPERRALPALPLSAAELQAVRASFLMQGHEVLPRLGEDAECSICMVDISAEDELICLPCGSSCRPHAFHAACLSRWLLTKAGACPMCRSLVHKRKTRSAPARSRALPPLPSPSPPLPARSGASPAPAPGRPPLPKSRTRSARRVREASMPALPPLPMLEVGGHALLS
ncbi:unnamed protein product [Effrenium voratum]|uniref:RING-type domain-containing protein n=1 Tax=Effrenium voratum TaxID=2562239 RepID=A0AA36IXD3_9DINO|nr:unnamed protein product [Effrenium voratum]CAJ1394620.1 unnamed protein product [Effrenium voratum]CAJ1454490.1 unnamed protein product [Effrenium voratum]